MTRLWRVATPPEKGLRVARVLACFCILSACAPFPGSEQGAYRDLDAPIGATTRFDPVRFAGDWVLVSRFGSAVEGRVGFTHDAQQNTMTLSSNVIPEHTGTYDIAGVGILQSQRGGDDPLIVMWVDEGFRTAVIGTENGDFGAILNRKRDIPADRAVAAREVLGFYGWDISKLQRTKP
ncbi:MAG: hypothetical protein R8G34_22115 [Paracoccaceae bacterium]|nr:hypothetical protein [Paracoccaceae bacterium]